MELEIRNGTVFDPMNGIDGERMDILIRDGKIVDEVSRNAEIIDASSKIVMPAAIDIHTHVAGSKVNSGRLLRPEDGRKGAAIRDGIPMSGLSVPNVYATAQRYIQMGYTFVVEPAVPPLLARHTHEEFHDMPLLDRACLIILDNSWITMELIRDGKFDELRDYVAWMLWACKGFGVKLVNPGGVEAWGFGGNVKNLDDEVPGFGITPREIIRGLARVNEELKLPHSIHIHCNNLGSPGNYETTLETLKCLEDMKMNGRQLIHVTHIQFHSYAGSTWKDMKSASADISSYINSHQHATVDIGQVMFCDTTTMTADGPMEYTLHRLTGMKWMNKDVEAETGGGIVPFVYSPKIPVHVIQWAIGLELCLLIKDPWKAVITTDHPNGAPFTKYPEIISMLMSRNARENAMKGCVNVGDRILLPSIDRELGWMEIATMTRAAPARMLGIDRWKGHLGTGADADVAIYDIDVRSVDPSKEYQIVASKMSRADYTIKCGRIVQKDGKMMYEGGRTFHVGMKGEIPRDVRDKFESYYTVKIDNYPVQDVYVQPSFQV